MKLTEKSSKKTLLNRIAELEYNLLENKTKKERIYMKSLELVLQNCAGWRVNGKKINSAEGYCELAEIFASNSITKC